MSEELPDYIGHRQRLKERFKLGGGGDMADYEMLELLLTLAIPRKDTKPLAKALVKEFGSFAEVCFGRQTDDFYRSEGEYNSRVPDCARGGAENDLAEIERDRSAGSDQLRRNYRILPRGFRLQRQGRIPRDFS